MRAAKVTPQTKTEKPKDSQTKVEQQLEEEQPNHNQSQNEESTTDQAACSNTPTQELPNAGKLIVDMSVAPADITFPTDIKLLNTAREKKELLIDTIYNSSELHEVKPRTYRKRAHRNYLAIAKQRKKSLKSIRLARHLFGGKALRKQFGYVGCNIATSKQYTNF